MKSRKQIVKLALVVVFLLGIIFILIGLLFPVVFKSQSNSLVTIAISVGCSLLATVISSFVLMQDDTQNEILEVLTKIDSSVDSFLKPEHTLNILKEVGIDVEYYKRNNQSLAFPKSIRASEIASSTEKGLEKFKIEKQYAIGHRRPTTLSYYYDLIGGTCDSNTAEYFAQLLSSFWAVNSADKGVVTDSDFDFVVTPKDGSPLLGYEFAKLVKKPFVLHEGIKRFQNNLDDMRTWFNCSKIPKPGSTALIVDDSTTGGKMVSDTIDHLREYNYAVHTCLVVFEPRIKDARTRLNNKFVQLVAIIKTH